MNSQIISDALFVDTVQVPEGLVWQEPDQVWEPLKQFFEDTRRWNSPGPDKSWRFEANNALYFWRILEDSGLGSWQIARPIQDPPDVWLKHGSQIVAIEATTAADPPILQVGKADRVSALLERDDVTPEQIEQYLVPGSPWCQNHPNPGQTLERDGVRWILEAIEEKCKKYRDRSDLPPLTLMVWARFADAFQLAPTGKAQQCWEPLRREASRLVNTCGCVHSAWVVLDVPG
jgi:hypothetical protein